MKEKEVEVRRRRRRKRNRLRRQAWFVAVLLMVCVLVADFGGGFLAGSSWQKHTGKERYPENGAVNTDGDYVIWENMAFDAQGKAMPSDDGQQILNDNGQDYAGRYDETPKGDAWNLILVNDRNPLPEGYEVDLVDVEDGECVDERIYAPLMEMLEDAREANWDQLPRVVSGHRTTEKQQEFYDDKISEYCRQGYSEEEAAELAGQWVARPGHSEHQLGLAVDINGATYDVYLWLQENSYKYGFIFRNPGNKTELTGVAEEVWHYRYVGVEAATAIYEQGICLEEYVATLTV